MAGESVSSLILFIAAMLVAAGVAGTLVTNVNELSSSIDTHSGDVRDQIDTDIEIISDPGSGAVYDDEEADPTITLLVKNTGERTLSTDPSGHDVLVDGRYVSNADLTIDVVEDGPTWRRGGVAEVRITLEEPLEIGEHRVVVTTSGDREVFEFYHG
ncbi:flagellar protein G [Halobacteria archaeon AArc-m2/3/4]|uniref:Flagellar protein G n=1 Tax=Natronoglomus mannanivorans TaxID=2979990 RepID=A0ABT2QH97_9EURY|nr:flagellar protein G [Halobacteria archaeon AArc-m2/3/4]